MKKINYNKKCPDCGRTSGPHPSICFLNNRHVTHPRKLKWIVPIFIQVNNQVIKGTTVVTTKKQEQIIKEINRQSLYEMINEADKLTIERQVN